VLLLMIHNMAGLEKIDILLLLSMRVQSLKRQVKEGPKDDARFSRSVLMFQGIN
jgi:hypothetical protein